MWAEYKYFPTDRDSFTLLKPEKTPKLSRPQQHWLNSRYDEGREVVVIVGMPNGGVILRDKAWMHAVEVECLLSRKEIASRILTFCSGPLFLQ